MPTHPEIPTELDLVEFIATEAHDLKSPFNRTLGFLKLVLKGLDGPISDQARDDLTIAFHSSQLALTLISGLIEAARLSRGEQQLAVAEYSLDSLIQGGIKEWNRMCAKEKPAEVSWQAPDTCIRVDERMFQRGLANWISYVSEFAPEETRVEITARCAPHHVTFAISSTGKKGVPPPACDLTLYGYLARQVVEMHGGTLECVEENEQGVQVTFTLPL